MTLRICGYDLVRQISPADEPFWRLEYDFGTDDKPNAGSCPFHFFIDKGRIYTVDEIIDRLNGKRLLRDSQYSDFATVAVAGAIKAILERDPATVEAESAPPPGCLL